MEKDLNEWRPIGTSKLIRREGEFLKYEYNKAGQVRRVMDDGAYRPVQVRAHVFQFGSKMKDGKKMKRFIYMPSKGILIVKNEERITRFLHLSVARRELGVKIEVGYTIKGWSAEYGWPMPHVVGVDMSAETESMPVAIAVPSTPPCPYDLAYVQNKWEWDEMTESQKKGAEGQIKSSVAWLATQWEKSGGTFVDEPIVRREPDKAVLGKYADK